MDLPLAEQRGLHDYWRLLKGDRDLPAWESFDPARARAVLPFLIVVEPVGEPPRFRARLYGTGVAAIRGADLTGRFLDDPASLTPEQADAVLPTYRAAIERRSPVASLADYRRDPGAPVEKQHHRLVLPFTRGGGDAVGILLVAILPVGPDGRLAPLPAAGNPDHS